MNAAPAAETAFSLSPQSSISHCNTLLLATIHLESPTHAKNQLQVQSLEVGMDQTVAPLPHAWAPQARQSLHFNRFLIFAPFLSNQETQPSI